MQPLEKTLRNKLQCKVEKAREIAEEAARVAVDQLGVGEAKPYAYLTEAQRDLRVKLRAHGRHLGDHRDPQNKTQAVENLVEETAYEHWHRMLFARFLAENDLLMYPDPDEPVAITLEECEELAAEEGASNGWELAARYATRMLPQIFRVDSPVFELSFPPEHQQKLENLLSDLPQDVFTASDSLGWVYQFWQSRRKEAVNQSGVKIGAKELPAVTQLFTEPYMVGFLLDNSLGAWWVGRRLSEEDLQNAQTEQELRQKAALPGVPLIYLRFVQDDNGRWTPAAGTFYGWPESLEEFKVMDPCCGSGHFLVAAFHMLVPMRVEMEGLSARQAVDAVLNNLHGLEIDKRCVELAAFALALSSWAYPGSGGYRILPEINVACSGLAINANKEEWLALARDNIKIQLALEELYKLFIDAPVLGSLINPEFILNKGSLFELKWEEVGPLLNKALSDVKDDEKAEIGVIAKGLSSAAKLLAEKFNLVFTNVPYLKGGYHSENLKSFCEYNYPKSKYDLSSVFVERCQELLSSDGVFTGVTQQHWLFLKYYEALRDYFIRNKKLALVARLGPGAFETISGAVVNVCLQINFNSKPADSHEVTGFELDVVKGIENKIKHLKTSEVLCSKQKAQLNNPNFRISFDLRGSRGGLLSEFACFGKGSVSGDGPHYLVSIQRSDNLFKFKEGENFNRRNTLSILRIKIRA